MKLVEIIKIGMIRKSRDDFANYLAEILNISKQAAGRKLRRQTAFTDDEITLLNEALNFSAEDLKTAFTRE